MNFVQNLKLNILGGRQISREEAVKLCGEPLSDLCAAADELRRHFCGGAFDLCSIFNGKSGKCPEDCKYCAQAVGCGAEIMEYSLVGDAGEVVEKARYNMQQGILRFSIVTSGRNLSDDEVDKVCEIYRAIREKCRISLCASHGLLSFKQLEKLKTAGVSRYHNNLETSRTHFPNVCTTHTYDDKIETLKAARAAGMEICSGGIIGLGESAEDRIDMAIALRDLGIKSVPVNVLNPIPGTPFAAMPKVTEEELRRTVAIFRFLIPDGAIRLAGGRELMDDKGKGAFQSGANAAISAAMLTTDGVNAGDDMKMLKSLNFQVKMI